MKCPSPGAGIAGECHRRPRVLTAINPVDLHPARDMSLDSAAVLGFIKELASLARR
jgi:hypothetical protein